MPKKRMPNNERDNAERLMDSSPAASSSAHRCPYLHRGLLAVRPGVVRNKRQRNPAILQRPAAVSRIKTIAGGCLIVGDTAVAQHDHTSQQVALELTLELRFGLLSQAHRQIGNRDS